VEARLVVASRYDDLAILRIAPSGLAGVALADSGVEVGDFVLTIGNPLGLGQSATFGIVSALHRACPGIENKDLILTDALIDRGDSGGALINMRGELVGINVARIGHSDTGSFGFAVPANAIRGLLARARQLS
jgi:S1-C subfamily serine protease